jgi:hypothetical protein
MMRSFGVHVMDALGVKPFSVWLPADVELRAPAVKISNRPEEDDVRFREVSKYLPPKLSLSVSVR